MDSDWIPSEENPGYNSKTIQHGSCTIIILRPALSARSVHLWSTASDPILNERK